MFAVKIGEKAIRKSIREQLGVLKGDAHRMGAFPTVIGEIGVPMEMDEKYSYGGRDGKDKGKGDYREQVRDLSTQRRKLTMRSLKPSTRRYLRQMERIFSHIRRGRIVRITLTSGVTAGTSKTSRSGVQMTSVRRARSPD